MWGGPELLSLGSENTGLTKSAPGSYGWGACVLLSFLLPGEPLSIAVQVGGGLVVVD